MRRSSLATSAMLHVAVLIVATISFPWLKHDYEVPQPMQVEMVDISDMAQTTKVAPTPEKVEKKIAEEKPPEPKKPEPAPTNKSVEPKAPTLKPPEKVEEKKEEKVEEKPDENAIPKKKAEKKPDKKPVVKKEEPKKDFASVLKNLADTKPTPAPATPAPPTKVASAADGQPLTLGQRMTMLEEDALRKQLEGCWNPPVGAKDADKMTVDIFMVINQDRTLQSARIVDETRYNNDTFFQAMADSAMRAVRNPNCSPFDVPPDKYESWKNTTITFDPSQMF